jgi:hypothetical protein
MNLNKEKKINQLKIKDKSKKNVIIKKKLKK